MRVRDSQKQKLYAAERCEHMLKWWDAKPWGTMIEVWVFLDRVRKDKWFRRHYGAWNFTVGDGRAARIARGGFDGWRGYERIGYLKLPRWSRTPLVIIHEIAHAVTIQKKGDGVAAHGREYAAIYLDLVRHFLGAEAAACLRTGYKLKGVKHRPKRVLSPERLEVMRDRGRQLAALRR